MGQCISKNPIVDTVNDNVRSSQYEPHASKLLHGKFKLYHPSPRDQAGAPPSMNRPPDDSPSLLEMGNVPLSTIVEVPEEPEFLELLEGSEMSNILALSHISEISQEDKGICAFVCMAQMLIDNNKLTLSEFKLKYDNSIKTFVDEWLRTHIKHETQAAHQAQIMRGDNVPSRTLSRDQALNQSELFNLTAGRNPEPLTAEELLTATSFNWDKRLNFGVNRRVMGDFLSKQHGMDIMADDYINPKPISELSRLGEGIYSVYSGSSKNIGHLVYVDKKGELMTWGKKGDDAQTALSNMNLTHIRYRLYPKPTSDVAGH